MEKENKQRLIDANALIKTMREEDKKCPGVPWSTTAVSNCIERLDPVDAVEVVHGRWEEECGLPKCPVCGYEYCDYLECKNYCGNCGAKMDGGNGDG